MTRVTKMVMDMLDSIWELNLTRYKFGLGSVNEIGYAMKAIGGSRSLLITDEGVAKAGLSNEVNHLLKEQGLVAEVWDGVEPEPSIKSIEVGIEWAENKGFDSFISVGGGSSIDTAKVVNLISSHGGNILDYVAPPTGRGKSIPAPLKPHIAIPTTAGTGSETSAASVISLPEKKIKVGISHAYCRPNLAIVDPLLHVSMPPKVTADSGMDTLAHAIESYVTRRYDRKPKPKNPLERPVYGGGTPVTDIFAEKAIGLIGKNLRIAVKNGTNIEARSGMALAATLAGIAFTNAGLTAVHAMAYPVGGQFHSTHGETNAILLPAVMEFLLSAVPEKLNIVAKLMGENIEGLSLHEGAKKSVTAIIELMKDINIPNGLNTFGVKEDDLPKMAEAALKIQRLLVGNPRPVTKENLERMYRRALKYW
ncbi:MAG: hydroxyacid-oxoacid transhydrogenase [Candidatus Hodarchaeales archaeon]|jgi:alcohol dehydrogenase class IV